MILTVAVSALSPFASTVAAKKSSEMTLPEQALSYTYLNALRLCVSDSNGYLVDDDFWGWDGVGTRISEAHAKSGDWFTSHDAWDVWRFDPHRRAASYLDPNVNGTDTDRGLTKCNDIVKAATQLWGYTDSLELLCSFVEKRTNGSSCATGNGDFNKDLIGRSSNLASAIKAKAYGGKDPSITDAHRYLYWREAFFKGCNAKASSSPAADFKYTVTEVNDDGTLVEPKKTYEGLKRDTKRFVYTSNTPNQLEKTCAEIEKGMNDTAQAYADYRSDHKEEATTPETPEGGDGEDKTSCAVEGVGWIICPAINFLAQVADNAYAFLADNFLEMDAALLNGTGSGSAKRAWDAMLGIANLAFVIAIMVIIYSQLTSVGVSNYGIKKLLPRVIIAAILVNLSYIICQIAVDVSNIAGYGLKSLFDAFDIPDVSYSSGDDWAKGTGAIGLAGIAVTVLATAAGIYLALPFLGGAVLAAVVALLFVGFLLIARKALIILLIVIAPLAFVAYLLPNTEAWFKKWRQMFVGLLMVFPVVGLLFGAGSLASKVLATAANGDVILEIVAALAAVIPLFAVWPVLKGSINAVGSIGAKVNGMSSRLQGKANSAGRKGWDNSRFGQGRQFRKQTRAQNRALAQGGNYTGRNPLRRVQSAANRRYNNSGLSGGFGDRLGAQGTALALDQQEKDIKNSGTMLQSAGLDSDQLQQLALGNSVQYTDARGKQRTMKADETTQLAALRRAMGQNNLAMNEDLIAASGGMSAAARREVAAGVNAHGLSKQANYLGGDMSDRILRGEVNGQGSLDDAAARRIDRGKLSAESLTGQDADALARFSRVADGAGGGTATPDASAVSSLRAQAAQAQSDPELSRTISGEQAPHIQSLAGTQTSAGGATSAGSADAPVSSPGTQQAGTPVVGAASSAPAQPSARQRAEATVAEAANGSSGSTVFAVGSSGEAAPQSAEQADAAAEAAENQSFKVTDHRNSGEGRGSQWPRPK